MCCQVDWLTLVSIPRHYLQSENPFPGTKVMWAAVAVLLQTTGGQSVLYLSWEITPQCVCVCASNTINNTCCTCGCSFLKALGRKLLLPIFSDLLQAAAELPTFTSFTSFTSVSSRLLWFSPNRGFFLHACLKGSQKERGEASS